MQTARSGIRRSDGIEMKPIMLIGWGRSSRLFGVQLVAFFCSSNFMVFYPRVPKTLFLSSLHLWFIIGFIYDFRLFPVMIRGWDRNTDQTSK